MSRTGIAAIAVVALLAGCGGEASEDEGAVEDAAQEQVDRYASGDIEGAWDMWVDDAKDKIPQDIYVAWVDKCAMTGAPLEVQDVRIDDPGVATVRVGIGDVANSYEMRFEGDEWRWVPRDETVATLEAVDDPADIVCD